MGKIRDFMSVVLVGLFISLLLISCAMIGDKLPSAVAVEVCPIACGEMDYITPDHCSGVCHRAFELVSIPTEYAFVCNITCTRLVEIGKIGCIEACNAGVKKVFEFTDRKKGS